MAVLRAVLCLYFGICFAIGIAYAVLIIEGQVGNSIAAIPQPVIALISLEWAAVGMFLWRKRLLTQYDALKKVVACIGLNMFLLAAGGASLYMARGRDFAGYPVTESANKATASMPDLVANIGAFIPNLLSFASVMVPIVAIIYIADQQAGPRKT